MESEDIVFIVQPSLHGNGGWCGSRTIEKLPLNEALERRPFDFGSDFEPYFEMDEVYYKNEYASPLRICYDDNPNHALDIEDDNNSWKKINNLFFHL